MKNKMKSYKSPGKLPKYGSLSKIVSLIKPGENVLDVGCSEGYLAKYLPDNKVWGIDYNTAAIKIAKIFCVEAKVVDLEKIENLNIKLIFEQKFDIVVFADILEHLTNSREVLQYFLKCLKPKGRIIVSLPNVALWRIRLRLLFGKFDYTDYGVLDKTHVHLYTYKSAEEFLLKENLRITKVDGAANLLGPLIRFFPVFKSLFSIHIILVAEK